MNFRNLAFLLLSILCVPSAVAKTKVLVTLPDFIEVVRALGGDTVEVDSLLDGREDPHFVDALPSFVTKASKADVVCSVGLDLEIAWLPKVLAKSGNAKVQSGGSGFCELGRSVNVLEKATSPVDRSMGDVHAAGNPHFYLSPSALIESSREVLRVLTKADPKNAMLFETNAKLFAEKMMALKALIQSKLVPVQSAVLIQYHKEFSYFLSEYGLKSVGSIEEKAGVPPSAARIVAVSSEAKAARVALALGALHSSTAHLLKFTEVSGVKAVKVPAGVQKNDQRFDSIAKVQAALADELLKISQP